MDIESKYTEGNEQHFTRFALKATGNFELLPDDVLVNIMKLLGPKELLSLSKVSRRMELLASDNNLWINIDFTPYKLRKKEITDYIHFFGKYTKRLAIKGFVCDFSDVDWKTCILSPQLLEDIRSRCSHLETLILNEYFSLASGLKLELFPSTLQYLSFEGSVISAINKELSYFHNMHVVLPQLKVLILDNCKWVLLHDFMAISKCAQLKELRLNGCYELTGGGVAYTSLAAKFGFKSLKILDLRRTRLGNSEVIAFYKIKTLTHLYLEDFSQYSRISHDDIEMDSHHFDDGLDLNDDICASGTGPCNIHQHQGPSDNNGIKNVPQNTNNQLHTSKYDSSSTVTRKRPLVESDDDDDDSVEPLSVSHFIPQSSKRKCCIKTSGKCSDIKGRTLCNESNMSRSQDIPHFTFDSNSNSVVGTSNNQYCNSQNLNNEQFSCNNVTDDKSQIIELRTNIQERATTSRHQVCSLDTRQASNSENTHREVQCSLQSSTCVNQLVINCEPITDLCFIPFVENDDLRNPNFGYLRIASIDSLYSRPSQLETLVIRHFTSVTNTTLKYLLGLRSLRFLDVTGTSVTEEGVLNFLLKRPEVKVVSDYNLN